MAGDPLVTAAIVAQTAEFAAFHTYQIAQDTALSVATAIEVGLLTTQMILYYDDLDDAIDARDLIINDQIVFMQTLEDLKQFQDLPMIICKKNILTDLELPVIDKCVSVTRISDLSLEDGVAVNNKSQQLSDESCGGIPSGWTNHEGSLFAVKSGSYAGGILANSETRRVEAFRSSRLSLVRNAHSGIKSIYNAGDTLNQYAQASAIYSGLADLFIQGFNSAGAALGVSLGKMATGTTGSPRITGATGTTGISLDAGIANNVGSTV